MKNNPPYNFMEVKAKKKVRGASKLPEPMYNQNYSPRALSHGVTSKGLIFIMISITMFCQFLCNHFSLFQNRLRCQQLHIRWITVFAQ